MGRDLAFLLAGMVVSEWMYCDTALACVWTTDLSERVDNVIVPVRGPRAQCFMVTWTTGYITYYAPR